MLGGPQDVVGFPSDRYGRQASPPRANLLRAARAAASREHLRIAIKLWHTRCVRLAEPHTPTARRRRCPDPRSPAQMTQVREIGVENDKGENFFGVQRRLPREQSEQLRSTDRKSTRLNSSHVSESR